MTAALAAEGLPVDLEEAILRLKEERNAILLAHYYQESEIQDLADVVADSLKLARSANGIHADLIVLCGVHFMAETAAIANPSKKVLIPDLEAGCSLAHVLRQSVCGGSAGAGDVHGDLVRRRLVHWGMGTSCSSTGPSTATDRRSGSRNSMASS